MKKAYTLTIICAIFCFSAFAQITLTFTGKDNLDNYVQLHHVVVENVTQGWKDTLYYPDTILIMSGVGLPDYESASAFSVSQNVPNPFDGVTDFTMTLPYEDKVAIEVFDMAGKRVTGVTQRLTSGSHSFRVWLNKPQSYLLSVRTSRDAASIKMLNNGGKGNDRIAYLQESPLTYELKSTKSGDHPFEPGDLMHFTGYLLYDTNLLTSTPIEQVLYEDETIVLIFQLWEFIQNDGHFCNPNALFIPDGTPCNGSCIGVVGIDVSGYPDGSVIQSAEDIKYVRLKMEHSYVGDLWISLSCPNGQSATILKKYNSGGSSGCTAQIPNAEWGWQHNDSPNVHFGQYYEPDGADKCDTAVNPMGICWNYCWSNNTGSGYQYACNDALVYSTCNQVNATNPSPGGQSSNKYLDSTNVAVMTNVFHPDVSFNALAGCPINGHWEIRFVDGWNGDNGYVQEAEIVLNADSSWNLVSLPSVTTGMALDVSYTSAVCGGVVISGGLMDVTARGICWDTMPNPTLAGQHTVEGQGLGAFTSTLDNLTAGVTYYYRAYATNAIGTAYGSVLNFITIPHIPPTVTTLSVTNITDVSAVAGGTVTSDGGLPILERGVCWSVNPNPTLSDNHIADFANLESFACIMSPLASGTTYYVRAYATNAFATSYGNQVSFTTIDLPDGITANYTYVSNTQVDMTGNISSDGGGWISARGFYLGFSPSPNFTIDSVVLVGATSTSSFSKSITGLIPGTTYYAKAFATNVAGTAYSDDVVFTTPAVPVVITGSVHNITNSTATSGGTVLYDGGLLVSDCGICWSTHPEPTLNDQFFSAGIGTGDFSCALADLENNTIYYVRAYAVNSVATVYGETISFITADTAFTCGVSTVRDYDDNIYHTLALGTQCWMKENMRTTRFPDGTQIPLSAAATATTPARCYPNGNANNVGEFGYLYNWCAAMHGNPPINNQGICPDGWHVPNNEDWQKLFDYVGGVSQYACGGHSNYYAKALAADYRWQTSPGSCCVGNVIANNNTTDFTMLPAGENEGSYWGFLSMASFHSSSQDYTSSCRIFYFYKDDPNTFSPYTSMSDQMSSVRCLHDMPLNKTDVVVITQAVDSITTSSAVISYTVALYGADTLFSSGVCWSTEPAPSLSDNALYSSFVQLGDQSVELTDLESNTVYYVRAFVSNVEGVVYGRQRMFRTLDIDNAGSATPTPILPIVKTVNISNGFNGTFAYCDGNVQFAGYSTVTERGICWNTSPDPTVSGPHFSGGSGTGVFTAKANGLTPGITYYFRAYATNSVGTAYGEELVFTVPTLPVVTTAAVSQNEGVTAISGGVVTSDGYDNILACGLCWDTVSAPTIDGPHTTDNPNNITFVSTMTGLTPATVYHVRAYATNRVGTAYGPGETFTTLAIPEITTAPLTNIDYQTAVSGGVNIQDHGDSITEKGLCWSYEPQPDIFGQHLAVGSDTAAFTATLSELTPGYRYYVRAYATNGHGTGYGQEISFFARNDANPCPNDTLVTDFDGNVYHTVQIGQQCWLRENLRSTHYADGSYFSESYYANNDSTTLALYGRLYKWNVVMQGAESSDVPGAVQGICPDGWHLPAKVEYDTLIDYVIATYTSSQKALASTSGWSTAYSAYSPGYQQSTNNASGFSAYPTGTTLTNEGFGKSTAFWTATKHPNTYGVGSANSLVIRNNSMQPYNSWFPLNDKLPVRCIKNN